MANRWWAGVGWRHGESVRVAARAKRWCLRDSSRWWARHSLTAGLLASTKTTVSACDVLAKVGLDARVYGVSEKAGSSTVRLSRQAYVGEGESRRLSPSPPWAMPGQ